MRADRFFWLTMALAGIVFAAWILGMFIAGDLSGMGQAVQWLFLLMLLMRIFDLQERVRYLEMRRPAAPPASSKSESEKG